MERASFLLQTFRREVLFFILQLATIFKKPSAQRTAMVEEPDYDAILADMRNNPVERDAFWRGMKDLQQQQSITELDMFELMRVRAACPQTGWTLADDLSEFLDKMDDVGHFMQLYEHHYVVMDSMVAPLTFAEGVNRWRAAGN